MDAAKNEDPAALCRKGVDDRFDLTQCFTGVELCFHIIFALQQFKVGDRFETHHPVPAGGVDHQIAGNGEEIGPAGRHIFPIFRGIGTGHDLCGHIFQFMGGRKYPPEPPAKSSFLWQDHCLEPIQFSASLVHVDPLDVSRASPVFICLS